MARFNASVPVVPRNVFGYNPDTKLLAAELSDFGPGFNFGRLYDDAIDIGFAMTTRDGGLAYFAVTAAVRSSGEGELLAWNAEPTWESKHKYHKLANVKVILFND